MAVSAFFCVESLPTIGEGLGVVRSLPYEGRLDGWRMSGESLHYNLPKDDSAALRSKLSTLEALLATLEPASKFSLN
jgi:hypothetical protein